MQNALTNFSPASAIMNDRSRSILFETKHETPKAKHDIIEKDQFTVYVQKYTNGRLSS